MMDKDKLTYGVSLGVFAVAALALGYFLFDASGAKGENEQKRDDENAAFSRYHAAAVFPSAKSVASVDANQQAYQTWREAALYAAARGDSEPSGESATVFKQRLQNKVRELCELPGGRDGKIAAAGFLFGFDQYLGENGQLPAATDVPRLAAQLDDIAHVVELLADAGVVEVTEVKRIEAPKADADENPRPGKKKFKKAAKKEPAGPQVLKFGFAVKARPAALVETVNQLTADLKFAVLEDFAFKSQDNMIDAKFRAEDAAKAEKEGGSRGGRRRRGAQQAAFTPPDEAGAKKTNADRLVTDPELDQPLLASFTVSIYDFGTKMPAAENKADGKEAKKCVRAGLFSMITGMC